MTEMPKLIKFLTRTSVLLVILLTVLSVTAVHAKKQARPEKGVGDQVQDIKSEVLKIAKDLEKLEQQLLYPSHSQIAFYVSLRDDQTFRLESVDIELNGKDVAYHVYSDREHEALKAGGLHRIHTGNVAMGKHQMKVTMRGKTPEGKDILLASKFTIEKDIEAGIAEIKLSDNLITLLLNR